MIIKKILLVLISSLKKLVLIPAGAFRFLWDFVNYAKQNGRHPEMPIKGIIPMITDRYMTDGSLDKHYFLQDIYVAQKVIENQPDRHFDIGSRVDGFIAHLLAAYKGKITLIDIRPLPNAIDGLNFICADATKLDNIKDGSIESLSSLHAIEHFGLGRYGDAVEPQACYAAMKSIQRVLTRGGVLYFSVPVGKQDAVYFNSHRMFRPQTILRKFDKMELLEFSWIHDYRIKTLKGESARTMIENHTVPIENYDCGIFIFKKVKE